MGFFSSFFGDSELGNIDARIDNVIGNLSGISPNVVNDSISGDFINEFMKEAPKTEIDKLLETVSVSKERLDRYGVYDEAYKYIPIIKRILNVYIANILQKNPVTGKCLLIREAEDLTGEKNTDQNNLDKAKKLADECIKSFDLILKLRKKILPNELIYGDCFIEVVNLNEEGEKKHPNLSISNVASTVPLFEAEIKNIDRTIDQLIFQKNHTGVSISKDDYQIDKILSRISEYFVELEESPSKLDNSNTLNKDSANYDDILVKIHKPHNVVILETDFGSILGYLLVTRDHVSQSLNLTQSLSTLVGRITNLHGLDNKFQNNNIIDRLIRYILKTILEKSVKLNGKMQVDNINDLLSKLPPTTYQYLRRLFVEQELASKSTHYNRLKVRFVPTSNMIAFTIPSAEHDPYGQSFVDSLVFPCKLYILSQLSNIIIKLSRAAPVRKWTIDVGQTQMQAGMIQKLKRELT